MNVRVAGVIRKNRGLILCMLVFFVAMFCLGWLADDAYHGLRMTDNFRKGYGFVYNPGERVNAATNPLFMIVVTLLSLFTRTLYWPMMTTCLICSSVAAFVAFRQCRSTVTMVVALGCMLACNCFMTYTTSGLENSMLFMLFGLLMLVFFSRDAYGTRELCLLSLLSSLIILCRMDNALLAAPILLYGLIKRKKGVGIIKALLLYLLCMLPFILWEAFSILYYGVPVPNTAYAKLSTSFPLMDYIERGLQYFAVSTLFDPILMAVPVLYFVLSVARKNIRHIFVCAGLGLYGLYILYIGGDFMVGRHFTVPFFIALMGLLLLARQRGNADETITEKGSLTKALACVLAGCLVYTAVVVNTPLYDKLPNHARVQSTTEVADERAFYYPRTSIIGRWQMSNENFTTQQVEMLWSQDTMLAAVAADTKGEIIDMATGILMTYSAGDKYIGDLFALGDPLLAHLPAVYTPDWRVGHMRRTLPEGYQESVRAGENLIIDPSLHEYYDVIRLLTRSEDLFAPERLRAIVKFNLGQYDYLIDEYVANEQAKAGAS